jgi:AraC family transcriptional regulator
VKPETRSHYSLVVQGALRQITRDLDAVLDLGALARQAALAPLHFHHIFRGLVGETPLELHRRLRLERAARQLASGREPVTAVAFTAGYEAHEAFTRAFRLAYGTSPSEFRVRSRRATDGGVRPPPFELASRSGLHFEPGRGPPEGAPPGGPSAVEGAHAMRVRIVTRPSLTAAALRHVGPYATIGGTFARLDELARSAGLGSLRGTSLLAVYHDDPEATPAAALRSDAALVLPGRTPIPPGLTRLRLPAGRYARTTHLGPYELLGDSWARLLGDWLPRSGRRIGDGVSYELYRNTPATVPPAALRTDLFLPLA